MCATAILFSCIRKKFTNRIDQMLKNTGASNALCSTELAMVDSALYQENFYLARKYLREAREKVYDYCNTKPFLHSCDGYIVHIACLIL
jgi:DNA primase large subunit